MTDPIADMLTRIRNAVTARHDSTTMPVSNLKLAIARILKEEGFVGDFEVVREGAHRNLRIWLTYSGRKEPVLTGLKRVSKPGLRVYAKSAEMPQVRGGLGTAIVSTSQGVMTARQARRLNLGGEVLCQVW
ncbi:MAG: 30S ribosomal protein S8 [Chloroflexi bacterium]|nr:30S ribosomal protein S8 [Chloroflexota bacterium]